MFTSARHARHGRRVAKAAMHDLGFFLDKQSGSAPVKRVAASAVCVMASDRWWVATAVGWDNEEGWAGVCALLDLRRDVNPVRVWRREAAVDLTELYLLFADAGTHTNRPTHVEDDLHLAQVRGLLVGGFQQLLVPVKNFDLESAEFLLALTPDGEPAVPPPYARRWNDAEATVSWMTGPVLPADGQACWMQWTGGDLTESGHDEVGGMRPRTGKWMLRSVNLLDPFRWA